ncbi:hypothetical protein B5V00_01690 [Geothermobacter hydrogeniphilus]|uniref:DNA 3'-5' helicase n=1 Tax=Geothermobacter hydrogeniphilus TaxID=1969733 RepID=A0A1X0YF46_9BACT|nr:hypothetical protein B5V00_01690 [Geothermobacter hydrogeniphilus]
MRRFPVTDALAPPQNDLQARREALDPGRSFIVQAPAGSGKTELLTQRLLALLSTVAEPEEILAITFTRKAAAEMRGRLLASLHDAADKPAPDEPHARQTWGLARKALRHADRRGWDLLRNPARLQLQTIDSFCSLLTRRMPWLSRFGAPPRISQDAGELYRLAGEKLLARLESGEPGGDSVALLLDHLDNQLSRLRDMVVSLLGRRDQWLRCLLDRRHQQAREQLEEGLRGFSRELLQRLKGRLGQDLEMRLFQAAEVAAENLADVGEGDLRECLENRESSLEAELACWDQLLKLVLTGKGMIRKTVNRHQGFPAGKAAAEAKQQFLLLLDQFAGQPGLLEALNTFRRRPDAGYGDPQWQLLDALIELLPLAVAELNEVFRQCGEIDFVEVAGAALRALGTAEAPEELLLQFDARLRHILIDEFQDTSYIQFELLRRLTAGWQAGDGRTLFLVGDPMQSIYRFRQAEVGYFLQVCRDGIGAIRPTALKLEANFRSQQGIVNWVNTVFSTIFPVDEDMLRGAVPYASAAATRAMLAGPAVQGWSFSGRQDEAEAEKVVELVRAAQREHPDGTVAVLVRARSHLERIIPALKRAGLPFLAHDLDSLEMRPLIQDLRALTRALLHSADRVSWLALVRAPWCGLSLEDLQRLIGSDRQTPLWQLLQEPADRGELFPRLTVAGQQRWERIRPVIASALQTRGRVPLRRLVETTWLALAGPACCDPSALPDAERFFCLLEELDCGGDLVDFEQLDRRLSQLFAAPDPQAGDKLQLMTIHKAKGLQFDTVILPGLGRPAPRQDRPLLNWIDHPEYSLLLAPVRRADSSSDDATYQAIQHLQQEKNQLETDRLIYVAVTRAIRRIHLLGHLEQRSSGELEPSSSSLLGRIWDQVGGLFAGPRDANESDAAPQRPPQRLQRLPLEWQPPPLADTVATRQEGVQSASTGHGRLSTELRINLRSQEGRMVGNLVHQLLEQYGQPETVRPTRDFLRQQQGTWKRRLLMAGIGAHRLKDCCGRILTAMEQTFHGRHADLLFDQATSVATEFALHGLVGGQLVHAAIDRTFIDREGQRWIVDYKTSQPAAEEPVDAFLAREKDHYAEQLGFYARLFAVREPGRPLCTALYFPLIDRLLRIDEP